MKIRVAFIAASITLLLGLLTGCGGGGSKVVTSSRKTASVTVTIQWPATGRGTTGRAIPGTVSAVLLEVFNGTLPVIAPVVITRPSGQTQTSVSLSLPSEMLIFYANAYAATPTSDYATNPATGLPTAPTGNASLARGVTTVNVLPDSSQAIMFTMNNNVVTLVPNFPTTLPQPAQTTAQPYQTIALDNAGAGGTGTLLLANLMSARDAQGNVLLLQDGDISWQVDPNDPLGAQKASVSGLTLLLKATGSLNLSATDTNVNAGQQQITGVFPILITPAAGTTTLTANITQIPLSARSVTLTVSYDALGATDTLPTPPTPVTTAFSPGTTTITQTVAINNNGRKVKLVAQAWSNADGTGTFYGSFPLDQQPVSNSPFTLPINSNLVSQPVTIQ